MKIRLYLICVLLVLTVTVIYGQKDSYKISDDIKLIKIENGFYIHKTWHNFPGFGRVGSNGLVFIKNGKAILIDTPGTNEQTEKLYNFLHDSLKTEIKKVISGHSHEDCTGGLSFLHSAGIESISGDKTAKICKKQNITVPKKTFSEEYKFDFEGKKVICKYFGRGHTIDNIVVYFPEDKILFGGCLIKSLGSKSLGNIKEADIKNWDKTVEKIKKNFKEIRFVIPGHGKYGNSDLLDGTINLVQKHKAGKNK